MQKLVIIQRRLICHSINEEKVIQIFSNLLHIMTHVTKI